MENRVETPDTPEVHADPNQEASSSQERPQAVDSPSDPPADEIFAALALESAILKNYSTTTAASASTPVGSSPPAHVLATPASAIPKQRPGTDLERDKSAAAATTTTTTTEPLNLKLERVLEAVQIETTNRNISDEKTESLPYDHEDSKWWILKILMELTLFLVLVGIFVAVLASNVLQDTRIWNLGAWRMCMLLFLVLSGWIVAKWVMDAVVFLVDVWAYGIKNRQKNYADRIKYRQEKVADADRITNRQEKVAYLIRGLKGSVAVFIWVAAILVAWIFIFRHEVEIIPEHVNEDLDKVTRGLFATLVGIFLWIWKSLLMHILAWSFIVTRSEPAVARNCKDQDQVRTLWDLASAEKNDEKPQHDSGSGSGASKPGFLTRSQLYVINMLNMLLIAGRQTRPRRKILEDEYKEIKSVRRNWTPRCLLRTITDTKLPVFVEAEHISDEQTARATADQLFKMIAKKFDPDLPTGNGVEVRYIKRYKQINLTNNYEKDQNKLLLLEKLKEVIPLVWLVQVDDRSTQRFRRSDFRKWMINVYKKRLVLIRTINGRDNVVGELNRVTSCAAILIIIFVWLLIMRSLTTQVMIAIATQIMALKFIFDDTSKTAFESIMFVFSTRPFDVGDHCMVEKVQMDVHDMNILSTIFKRDDGKKLYYPNSALIRKTLINFCSQGDMSFVIEFKIDAVVIEGDKLKKELEKCLNYVNKVWNIKECVMKVKKDENDKNKRLVILKINHLADFYKGGNKKTQRVYLVEEMEKIIKKVR